MLLTMRRRSSHRSPSTSGRAVALIGVVVGLLASTLVLASPAAAETCTTTYTGGPFSQKIVNCSGYHDEFIGSKLTGWTSLAYPTKALGYDFISGWTLTDKAADGNCASVRVQWTGPWRYDSIVHQTCGKGKVDNFNIYAPDESITGAGYLIISNCQPGSPTGYCSVVYKKFISN